jgi:hypothetical protein
MFTAWSNIGGYLFLLTAYNIRFTAVTAVSENQRWSGFLGQETEIHKRETALG